MTDRLLHNEDVSERIEDSPLSYGMDLSVMDYEHVKVAFPEVMQNPRKFCPACGKNRGELYNGVLDIGGKTVECDCYDQVMRARAYTAANIGKTYQFLGWSDFHGDPEAIKSVSRYVEEIDQRFDNGIGMFLFSHNRGTGKTMLGTLTLKEFILRGKSGFFTTYADYVEALKAGWKDPKACEWIKTKVETAQVLMLDDVGQELTNSERADSFSISQLDRLIRNRAQRMLPTIITTNFDVKQFFQVYGEGVKSLLTETFMGVPVGGEDYRPKTRDNRKMGVGKRRIH